MFNTISITLFSLFPISLILGNSSINLNIVLIDFLVLYYSYKSQNWWWLKDKVFKLLIILNFYFILNSMIFHYLTDFSNYEGLIRSFSFLKFIILAYAFKLLITNQIVLDKIINNWAMIIGIIILDVFFEKIYGHNILGNISPDSTRVVSFFKDELVVGGLILCFGFIISTYFLDKNLGFKSKLFYNTFLFLVPFSIFITGEKSNFLKSFIIFSFIVFLIDKKKLLINKKIFLVFSILAMLGSVFLNESIYIKQTESFKRIYKVKEPKTFISRFQNIKYFGHYDVGLKIFKDFPISGVSSKNFRNFCSDQKYFDKNITFTHQRCATHPHQVHFELLSEHGLIGYFFLFYLFFIFFKKNLIKAKLSNNIFYYSSTIYLIIFFTPLLPGGAMFSTFNGALFWIVFSIANLDLNKKIY